MPPATRFPLLNLFVAETPKCRGTKLPTELRWQIRVRIYALTSMPWETTDPPFPQLALVNREFRNYFSDINFRILVLRVKLPEYDCSVCNTAETSDTHT